MLPCDDDPELIDAVFQMACRRTAQSVSLFFQDLQQPAGMAADPLVLAAKIIADLAAPVLVFEEHELVLGAVSIHHM